jgi:hypothetical protein
MPTRVASRRPATGRTSMRHRGARRPSLPLNQVFVPREVTGYVERSGTLFRPSLLIPHVPYSRLSAMVRILIVIGLRMGHPRAFIA